MKRWTNLFFKLFLLFSSVLSAEDDNLVYFLKNDKLNIKLANQAKKDIYINKLDIERFAQTPRRLNEDSSELIEIGAIHNYLTFDVELPKSLKLATTYYYNVNELKIREEISDIILQKEYAKMLVSLKYENVKTIDMLDNKNRLDSDTYSLIFDNKPHNSSINKDIKVQIDWVKSNTNFKFNDATFLKLKHSGGKFFLELNIRFARD